MAQDCSEPGSAPQPHQGVRPPNRVTLTPAGRNLVEHAERILAELRAAEAMLSTDDGGLTGLLRVGVPFHEGPRIMKNQEVPGQIALTPGTRAATSRTAIDRTPQ